MKNPNAAYYRLGLFVLVGIFLAVVLTVVFSSGKLFNKTYVVETYVEGSVTGLDDEESATRWNTSTVNSYFISIGTIALVAARGLCIYFLS